MVEFDQWSNLTSGQWSNLTKKSIFVKKEFFFTEQAEFASWDAGHIWPPGRRSWPSPCLNKGCSLARRIFYPSGARANPDCFRAKAAPHPNSRIAPVQEKKKFDHFFRAQIDQLGEAHLLSKRGATIGAHLEGRGWGHRGGPSAARGICGGQDSRGLELGREI